MGGPQTAFYHTLAEELKRAQALHELAVCNSDE
jgi:hypothetical protein